MIPPALASVPAKPPPAAWSVLALDSIDELAQHVPAWDDLAAAALEPNVFFESWMLLPALRRLGGGVKFRFLLVYRPHATNPKGAPVLCGFFPFARKRRFRYLPVTTLSLWTHPFGLLGTPLIRRDEPRRCLDVFFQWLGSDPRGASLVELDKISADGRFYQELIDFFHEKQTAYQITECWTRALLRTRQDAATCLEDAFSGEQRKSLRRKAKRLGEEGAVEYRALKKGDDLDRALKGFLEVEGGGWKGRQGTSISSRPGHGDFFLDAAREGFRRGRLELLSIFLAGRPIAYQCYFPAGEGAFAFKTAYDESYSRFSPGILIQTELIQRLHAQDKVRWMDSNSEADGYLNSVWPDRRVMQNLLVATRGGLGRFFLSALPLLKWLKDQLPLAAQAPG